MSPAVFADETSEGPTLDRYDLTGDGIADTVQAYPHGKPADEGNVPGEVHIISGATGETLRIVQGAEVGDEFGFAIAYGGDLNRNGHIELLIGAPNANAVAVVSAEIVADDNVVVTPEECSGDGPVLVVDVVNVAEVYYESSSNEIFDAGYDVGAFYDFREDGWPTFRFAARYINDEGQTATREYIVHGYTGLFLARVERYAQHDGLARPRGDATRDGVVREDDTEKVIDNLGTQDETLSADEGDFTSDQQVNEEDLVIVLEEQGKRLYDPTTDTPPDDFSTQNEGCDSYYATDGEDQWYHIELFGLGCYGPMGAASDGSDPSDDCFDGMMWLCEDHQGVQQALNLIQERCCDGNEDCPWGNHQQPPAYCVDCEDLPDDFEYEVDPRNHPCGVIFPEPEDNTAAIVICVDLLGVDGCPSNLCDTFAHELTHFSQYCNMGLGDEDPDTFWDNFDNFCNQVCTELEAYDIQGACDDDASLQECCEWVCKEQLEYCPVFCEDICGNIDECCNGGIYTCENEVCDE